MFKDLADKLPTAAQPTGPSGLPLAAEMILRAIAEQVEKLAHAQQEDSFDSENLTQPEFDALNQTANEFLSALAKHCANVSEYKNASQQAAAHTHDSSVPLESLTSFQRNLNAKAVASISQLSQHLHGIVADGSTFGHLGSSAQDVTKALSRLKLESTQREKDSSQVLKFLADTVARADFQKNEIERLRAEVGTLRSSLRLSQGAWSELWNAFVNKNLLSQELKQQVESLKATASHIQVLAVNTGIEATKTATEDSGLSYISSDLRKIAEQCGSIQRSLSQKFSALDELAHEFQAANQIMTSKDVNVRESLTQIVTQPDYDSHLNQNSGEIQVNVETTLRGTNKKVADSISQLESSIYSHTESITIYQTELPRKLEALRQSAHNFETFLMDLKNQFQLTQRVAQENQSLRTTQQTFSEKLNALAREASQLQSEAERAWNSVYQHLAFKPSDGRQQVTEINEQLKQCAQEIFSLVDTPDTRRMAS